MAENESAKVHYDLYNVHVAKLTLSAEGKATYGTPKRLSGAIGMDLAAEGDVTKLRADSTDYYVSAGNNGYSGDLSLAMVPDWFKQEYLGNTLTENKVIVENTADEPIPFALIFEFKQDKKHRRHVLYNCVAARPSIKGENKDNPKEPDTEALTLTCSPLPNGDVKASTCDDTDEAIYTAWLTSVWQKAEAAS